MENTMPRKPKKRAPPSRIKYEASHPVVSVRVSRELRADLRDLKRQYGLSMADILKIGIEKADQAAVKAHQQGYRDALGESLGKVEDCPRCWTELSSLIPDDI